jgi:hypothetical protein
VDDKKSTRVFQRRQCRCVRRSGAKGTDHRFIRIRYQVHRASHPLDQLVRDHEVGLRVNVKGNSNQSSRFSSRCVVDAVSRRPTNPCTHQIAIRADLHGTEDGDVDMSPADHGETLYTIEY